MAPIDMTQKKLKLPPKFVPYLEKHRIFELFHEMAEELIMEQPGDHIEFLRDVVMFADKKRDRPRIVFFSPPGFDREAFAEAVAEETGVLIIYRNLVQKYLAEARTTELANQVLEEYIEEENGIRMKAVTDYSLEEMTDLTWQQRLQIAGVRQSEVKLGEACGCAAYFRNLLLEEEQQAVIEEELPAIEEEVGIGLRFEKVEEEEVVKEKEDLDFSTIKMCPCKYNMWKLLQERESSLRKVVQERREEVGKQGGGKQRGAGHGWETGFKETLCKHVRKEAREEAKEETGEEEEHVQTLDELSMLLANLLKLRQFRERGWILAGILMVRTDMPDNKEEARIFARNGILPTHAYQIITCERLEQHEVERSRTWAERNVQSTASVELWAARHRYRMELLGWTDHYSYVPVMQVVVGRRHYQTLARDLRKLMLLMPHRHPPLMPRILLLGSRGSGVKTQARKLSNKYHFVHVNYDEVMERALLEDNVYARKYQEQIRSGFVEPEVEVAVLERKLLSHECLTHGWVLTGYPKNSRQFRMLDLTDTPPNRVIFLHVPPKECFLRVHYREVDSSSGEVYKVPEVKPTPWGDHELGDIEPGVKKRLQPHPKDDKNRVVQQIEDYFLCQAEMEEYCGQTAQHVNGNKPIQGVFEMIDQVIINSAPACKLRKPIEDPKEQRDHRGYRTMPSVKERFQLLTKKKVVYLDTPKPRSESSISSKLSDEPPPCSPCRPTNPK